MFQFELNWGSWVERRHSEFWKLPFPTVAAPSPLGLSRLSTIEIWIGGKVFAKLRKEQQVNCCYPDTCQSNQERAGGGGGGGVGTTCGCRPFKATILLASIVPCFWNLVQGVTVADWEHLKGLSRNLILPSLPYIMAIFNPQAVVRIEDIYVRRRYIPGILFWMRPPRWVLWNTTHHQRRSQ